MEDSSILLFDLISENGFMSKAGLGTILPRDGDRWNDSAGEEGTKEGAIWEYNS